jgi:hypothetical protein
MQKKRVILSIIGILVWICLFLISVNYFPGQSKGITGKIINEPYIPEGCSDSELKKVWEDIFFENSDNIFIVKNTSSENCEESYYMYKVKENNETFILVELNLDGSRNDYAIYLNASPELAEKIKSIDSDNLTGIFRLDIEEGTKERIKAIENISEANYEFKNYFKLENSSWEEKTNEFDFDEENETEKIRIKKEGGVYKDKYFMIFGFYKRIFPQIILTKQIPDFTYEMNTGWSDYLDLDDYFNDITKEENNIEYSIIWINGSNEEKVVCQEIWRCYYGNKDVLKRINITIDEKNKIKFKPKTNFTGQEKFKIKAEDHPNYTESNEFYVKIVEEINHSPNLTEDFEDFMWPKNTNYSVDLFDYFEDPDEDELTFRTNYIENISVEIDEDRWLVLIPDNNFTGIRELWIYANDSELETRSEKIDIGVFEEVILDLEIVNDTNTSQENGTINNIPQIINFSEFPSNNITGRGNISFFVNAIDPDEDELSYKWYLNDNLVGENITKKIFNNLSDGENIIKVDIDDGKDKISKIWNVFIKKDKSPNGGRIFLAIIILIAALISIVIILMIVSLINENKENIGKSNIEFKQNPSNQNFGNI